MNIAAVAFGVAAVAVLIAVVIDHLAQPAPAYGPEQAQDDLADLAQFFADATPEDLMEYARLLDPEQATFVPRLVK